MAHVFLAIFWGRGELVAFYAHAYNELYPNTIVYLLIPKQLQRERERKRKRDFLGHLVYP